MVTRDLGFSLVRGLPFSMYAKFSGFLTPPSPCYAFHATYQSYHTQKLAISLTPLPPQRVRTKWKPPYIGRCVFLLEQPVVSIRKGKRKRQAKARA